MWQIIIIILGLIFGFLIGKVNKDEIKQGKKYFLFSEKILLLIIILVLLFFYKLSFLILLGLVIGLVVCKFFKRIYFYLGIVVFCSLFNKELFLIIISLVFLFSLIYGSLSKFKLRNFLLDMIVFFLPFVFLFMQSFINTKIGFFIGFSIGGIIEWARGSAW